MNPVVAPSTERANRVSTPSAVRSRSTRRPMASCPTVPTHAAEWPSRRMPMATVASAPAVDRRSWVAVTSGVPEPKRGSNRPISSRHSRRNAMFEPCTKPRQMNLPGGM